MKPGTVVGPGTVLEEWNVVTHDLASFHESEELS